MGKRWRVNLIKPIKGQAWLNCYQRCPKLLPGESWWIQGNIKKIVQYRNPGQMNFWYQSDSRHIIGQLILKPGQYQKDSNISSWDIFNQIRIFLYQKANQCFNSQQNFAKSLFLTLVLGIGSELSNDDWQVFKDTGTAHLMVVSGAHLGLLMILVGWIVEQLYKMKPSLIPIKKISSAISLSIGLFYALLSGFGIPVQRAWLMKFFFDLKYWVHFRISPWQSFRYALCIIVVFEPHAIMYPGAYLSFLAVAILMITPKIFPYKSWWIHLLTQLCCLLGMSPLTILWFSSVPLTGILANYIAIPWVSWVVLPLSLLMIIFWGEWGRVVFELVSQVLYQGLVFLQHFEYLNIHVRWSHPWMAWYVLLALGICVIYPHWKMICFLIMGFFSLNQMNATVIPWGSFYVDVLDVGQGLSVLVRTQKHSLLYDTAGMQGKRSLTQMVVLPYLKWIHLTHLDALVLSHPDLDHIAGRKEILQKYPKANLMVDNPRFYHAGVNCRKLRDWCWDDVCFHFYQGLVKTKKKNDHSCVLEVYNSKYHILLTGDIEKKAEEKIIQERNYKDLTVLLVPHHGSKTSSTEHFLKKLKPQLALVSVALYNHYHLPHPMVQKRYHQLKIPWLSTANHGWIQIQFLKKQWKIKTLS